MPENAILFSLGSLQITCYSLCIGAGALLAVLLTFLTARGRTDAFRLCLITLPCALIGSHLVYALARLPILAMDYQNGLWLLAMPWMGGYNLYGSVLFALLGVWLADRAHFGRAADAAAPGAMVMLACARAAELFTGEGLGTYLDEGGACFFPLGLCTYADAYWSEWRVPVFFWEALTALLLAVLALALLRRGGRPRRDGSVAELTLALMSAAQILLESLRLDETIKFGFVRFNQLAAAVVLLAVLVVRMLEYRSDRRWQIARCALFALCVGGVIAIEFALDKSPISNLLLYAAMALILAVLGTAVLVERKRSP